MDLFELVLMKEELPQLDKSSKSLGQLFDVVLFCVQFLQLCQVPDGVRDLFQAVSNEANFCQLPEVSNLMGSFEILFPSRYNSERFVRLQIGMGSSVSWFLCKQSPPSCRNSPKDAGNALACSWLSSKYRLSRFCRFPMLEGRVCK